MSETLQIFEMHERSQPRGFGSGGNEIALCPVLVEHAILDLAPFRVPRKEPALRAELDPYQKA
jgi:hypothetical protein